MTARASALAAVVALSGVAAAALPPPQLNVACDDADGIVAVGQPVSWTIAANRAMRSASYTITDGGLAELATGALDPDRPMTVTYRPTSPGTLLLRVTARTAKGTATSGLGGVAVEPTRIAASAPRPDDFDAFWQSKLDELAAVPIDARLSAPRDAPAMRPADEASRLLLRLNNVRGLYARGQIARPGGVGRRPALLMFGGAGVYATRPDWTLDRAAEGWITLHLSAHDLPTDAAKAFYESQRTGAMKDYASRGSGDREASYFLPMLLGAVRAVDYVKTLDDWDGRTIVVHGASQGGLVALAVAALRPADVTALIVDAPAGADMLGADVGRMPGWPRWVESATRGAAPGADVRRLESDARRASRYFDLVNFAPRVRCPVLIGVGLIDETCPPAGIYAAANRLGGAVEALTLPTATHGGGREPFWTRAAEWRAAILAGGAVPTDRGGGGASLATRPGE